MPASSDSRDSLIHDLRRGEIIWVLKQDYPHLVTFGTCNYLFVTAIFRSPRLTWRHT